MDTAARRSPAIRQLMRKVSGFLTDWTYAQRRVIELKVAPSQNVFQPDTVPQTYAEFLYRTSGVLQHEPPARARAGCS
jgi:hypothetical protein